MMEEAKPEPSADPKRLPKSQFKILEEFVSSSVVFKIDLSPENALGLPGSIYALRLDPDASDDCEQIDEFELLRRLQGLSCIPQVHCLAHVELPDAYDDHRCSDELEDLVEPGWCGGMVMEWIDGGTLKQNLDSKDPELLGRLMDALAELSNAGILHTDLHSENVMLRGDGRVVFIDFESAFTITDPWFARHYKCDLRNRPTLKKLYTFCYNCQDMYNAHWVSWFKCGFPALRQCALQYPRIVRRIKTLSGDKAGLDAYEAELKANEAATAELVGT